MIASQVQIKLDEEQIKKYIKEQLDQQIRHEYLFVDVNKLADMMSVSKRWLEEHVLDDARVAVCMRQKNRKRLYIYPDVVDAIKEIAEEW